MSNRIKITRIKKMKNAARVAKDIGVSRQRYSSIESRKSILRIKDSLLRRISSAIGCSVYEFGDASDFMSVFPQNKRELDEFKAKLEEEFNARQQ